MTRPLTRRRALQTLLMGSFALGPGLAACAAPHTVAKKEQARPSDTRELTIALWAGASEKVKGPMPRVDIITGNDPNRFIRGPFEWTNERTGASYWVYERLKERKTRTKRQLLTVTHDGRGLGRVLDERTGAPARWFEHDIIFPLGRWGRGEQRSFKAVEHTIAGPAERIITLKIRRLDFTFRDVSHSMKYDWIARDAAGRVLHSERYVYSPGKGLVRFTNRLKDNARDLSHI